MNLIKDESGVALIYVIVVMLVVFLLVGGIVTVSMNENAQALYQSEEVMAYYVSRAGAESMVYEMKRMNKNRYQHFGTTQLAQSTNILDTDGDDVGDVGDVDVTVTKNGDYYDIVSVGTYKGHTATTKIRMEYVERVDFDFAAYAIEDMGDDSPSGDISIKEIIGGLGSGGDIFVKNADVGPGKAIEEDEIIPNFQHDIDIVVPDVSSLVIANSDNNPSGAQEYTTSMEITNLDLNQSITVDTTDAEYDIEPYEDYDTHFELSDEGAGNGDWMILRIADKGAVTGGIIVNGDKNLMIIVDDALYLDGGIEINDSDGDTDYPLVRIYVVDESDDSNGDVSSGNPNSNGDYDLVIKGSHDFGLVDEPAHLNIYLYGELNDSDEIVKSNKMAMNNNSDFYGYILGPEAEVDLKNGSTKIYGAVYAAFIDFEASVSIENPDSAAMVEVIYKEMQIAYWE